MDLTRECQRILTQLSDMFAEVPQARILQVCEENAFNIELCIDQLITNHGTSVNESNFSITMEQQEQVLNNSSWSSICRSSSCEKDMQQGAIPKGSISQAEEPSEHWKQPTNSKGFKNGSQNTKPFTPQEQKILDQILAGYRVMVLMRGAPGCGKTYLANTLVQKSFELGDQYKLRDFICGADDFFFNSRGQYKYNVEKLTDAHNFNKRRVREKAANGWSPIFVDNTNMKLWEMLPYAQAAVQYGYIIEILEPMTSWRNSPGKLAMKNRHRVPKEKILIMLDKYEKGTVGDLFKMLKDNKYSLPLPHMRNFPPLVIQNQEKDTNGNFQEFDSKKIKLSNEITTKHDSALSIYDNTDNPKPQRKNVKSNSSSKIALKLVKNETAIEEMLKDTKYSLPLPQMRNFPPLVIQDEEMDTNENFQEFENKDPLNNESTTMHDSMLSICDTTASDNPKPQRKNVKSKSSSKIALNLVKNETAIDEENNNKLLQNPPPLVWKPYEVEANQFWRLCQEESEAKLSSEPILPLSTTKSEKSLLDLLKEGVNELPANKFDVDNEEEKISFQKHRVNCPNENKSFASLRQIYPNKQLNGLWDLFVKCNGDIDWAVDILLKEDELSTGDSHYNDEDTECVLMCSCTSFGDPRPATEVINLLTLSPQNTSGNIKPQRLPKTRSHRFGQNPTSAQREVKETIESNFVLGEEFYSQHIRKIKNFRSGNVENTQSSLSPRNCTDTEVQTDPVIVVDAEDDMENDSSDLLEINLGDEFVKQLSGIFSTETFNCKLPENLKTNVFMPKTLAKELFMLWMESAYNQIEEKRQITVREDEEFAHLVKNPKYEHFEESPNNIKEILDMELAWMIYKNEHEEQKQYETRHFPTDIASHLTQMKLCELFPNIPRETLLDIFAAHGNKFKETIEVLQSTMNTEECTTTTQEQLLERAIQENELLNNQEEALQNQHKNQYPIHSINDYQRTVKSPLLPDESKRIALRAFEDTRNFAAHHCQLKAECYQKAKDAIQKGNSAIAVYYSQIANLHKKKIDMYNHRAANCIMEVHKYTQNNPDLLDLHYLYVLEAVGCLDLFLDRHIMNLRSLSKSYKHVFIITGRGLHSAGGVSTIKNKVKSRLKERSLRWSEVNPGLLKVKIFSASRYSKNI